MMTREQQLEELRVEAVLACDRAIDALTAYKRKALALPATESETP